ncbi:MAG: S-methyl-5-thioribose-1-phosphate isomerase [Candidatus Aminicenantales bacterium]
MLPSIEWKDGKVVMIDQRKLPREEVYVECTAYEEIAEAVEKMVIRGAPAIGVAAAFGVALGLLRLESGEETEEKLEKIIGRFKKTRPTARNLFWALERMKEVFETNRHLSLARLKEKMVEEALALEKEDVEVNKKIGYFGKDLLKDGHSVLTYCNTGSLATAGFGTALGVIRAAVKERKRIKVYASETRPFLQGARLTCWELTRDGIPAVLITDNAAGFLMQRGEVSLVITGADRVARNGDTANKIGTYSLAVLARECGVPFYIASPLSSVDFSLRSGQQIPVEERNPDEVKKIAGKCLTLPEVEVFNPSFDITPARYISAIITEHGFARPPFEKSLSRLRDRI